MLRQAPGKRSLLEIVDEQEQIYPSVDFVKAFIQNASKHEGPLKGDDLLLQMMKAANSLPLLERQAVTTYLASLPADTLKRLDRPSLSREFETALAEGIAESIATGYIKPLIAGALVTGGLCAAPVSVPAAIAIGTASAAAPYVVSPAMKFAVYTGKTIGEKCLKVGEKESARQLKSGLNAGVKRAGVAISATYDRVSKIAFRRVPVAAPAASKTQSTDKSLIALEQQVPALLLSKPAKRSHPLVQEVEPAIVHADKKPNLAKKP